jgi:hypothetical protein
MYLFFVRHFNDIDHTTPVVWKMKKDNYPVAVYCINPRYDIWSDYRLCFLKNQGVTVNYLHHEFDQHRGRLHERMHAGIQQCFAFQKRLAAPNRRQSGMLTRLLGQLAGLMGTLVYKLTRTLYYDMRWARSILEHSGARAICFDHILPKRYVVNSFLKAAREMSIPALSLPHGVLLYTNEKTKPKSTDKRRFTKFSRFNFILVPNQLRKEVLVRTGVAEEKIFVLGSARYCGEWLEQNKTILPRVIEPNISSSDKLKVVFMQSKPQCRVDLERMSKTIDLLADLAEIEAMLKPHTRIADKKRLFDETRLPNVSHVLTAELCEWADVLLVVGSSVITEALMQNKPVLYLKYLHENTTLFEDLGACWIISNETELKMALLALQKNKTDIPYGADNITEFISEIVYGGGHRRDVLSDYEQFIVGCASN